MTNKPKRPYRSRNRADYNKALVQRGSLTLRVEEHTRGVRLDQDRPARRGRRRTYTDVAITCALTLRAVYGLPRRSTQGLIRSLLRLRDADLPAPHTSTLARRAAVLALAWPRLNIGPRHLAVASPGMKLYGAGAWQGSRHGTEKRRTWRKLHLAIDHRTHEVGARALTDKEVLDRSALPRLLSEVKGEVTEVLGDGAYDFQDCYKTSHARGARSVIPPKKRASVRGGAEFGDRAAAVLRGREVGTEQWKRASGYHRRSLTETALMRLKTSFTERLKARAWKGQVTELRVRCATMNRMTGLGLPRSYAV